MILHVPVRLKVLSMGPMTEERIKEIFSQVSSIQSMFDGEAPPATAAQNALAALKADPSVETAGLGGNDDAVWWVTREGIPCIAERESEDSRGSGEPLRQGAHRVDGTPLPWSQLVDMADDVGATLETHMSQNLASGSIGNYDVIVLNVVGTPREYDDVAPIADKLRNSSLVRFCVENESAGAACTVDRFKLLGNHGIVIVSTHGNKHFQNFRRYCAGMPDSIVYVSSCRSAYNNALASALFDAGARVFYGWKDVMTPAFHSKHARKLFDNLLAGLDSGTAFKNVKGPDNFVMYGDDRMVLSIPGIKDGSFEQALKYWGKEGDVRAIGRLGPLEPKDGNLMAIVSTGLGAISESKSAASQRFVVPDKAVGLTFWYDVISEEPREWLGKEFDDTVEILIGEPDGDPTLTVTETVNGSDWQPIEGIDFPGGDDTTYHTGWKNRAFIIAPFRGKTVVLGIRCWDAGDSAYDTAVIVDKFELVVGK